jgi:[ribosomal protein S5]-alanine N-acetyltransferase
VSVGPLLMAPGVVLRPPDQGDIEAVRLLGVDPVIWRFFGEDVDPRAELTVAEARAFVGGIGAEDASVEWVIEAYGAFIGTARLHTIDGPTAWYAVGILSAAHLGRGIGTQVTRLALAYGFGELGLAVVRARVLSFNTRALRCYGRCGFVEERREERALQLDGVWHDDVILAVEQAGLAAAGA